MYLVPDNDRGGLEPVVWEDQGSVVDKKARKYVELRSRECRDVGRAGGYEEEKDCEGEVGRTLAAVSLSPWESFWNFWNMTASG